jgi:hypothetical protein
MAEYRTVREIANRMRWSPAKVLRRHKLDDFPLYQEWTKRGPIWATSDELILLWEQNKVQMSQGARLRPPPRPRHKSTYHPYNWRLRYKNETPSRTIGPTPVEEKSPQLTHEEPTAKVESRPEPLPPTRVIQGIQRIEGCVCGTGLNCAAHGEPL